MKKFRQGSFKVLNVKVPHTVVSSEIIRLADDFGHSVTCYDLEDEPDVVLVEYDIVTSNDQLCAGAVKAYKDIGRKFGKIEFVSEAKGETIR